MSWGLFIICVPFTLFRSYNRKENELDGAKLRTHLLGGHVAAYMRRLQDKSPEDFQSHFSRFLKEGLTPDSLENIYKTAHAAIRADPIRKPRAEVSLCLLLVATGCATWAVNSRSLIIWLLIYFGYLVALYSS